ncbi:MAG: hypothetical protein M1823_002483 [Watsoniomyces obsoletus]|nr:MAG: hypothetical protein M1823_002483 [Watsoniomyces obsoletus]
MLRSRWGLQLQAQAFRQLMEVGMVLHRCGEPRPPAPSFTKTTPTTLSRIPGNIDLLFYTPEGYHSRGQEKRYAVVVNFHGGGFTIGKATDDARWAKAVVEQVDAVLVSVEYRLAPEHPFPTSVEDGADAVLYLVEHAEELGLDRRRIATSGFSAGGNLAVTVPIRLQAATKWRTHADAERKLGNAGEGELGGNIVAIVAWYPSTDFATHTRAERRSSNTRPDRELPKVFTDLFDASYLYPPHNVSMSDPYLSPGVAPAEMLKALPDDIIIYTCEWDELLVEAERFRDRLIQELGKNVIYRRVDGVPHAWDKSPNFLQADQLREEVYAEVCSHLKRVFDSC